MTYRSLIKWLSNQPAPLALGLLFWSEIAIFVFSLAGGWLLARFFVEFQTPFRPVPAFILTFIVYMVAFYILHFIFGRVSQLYECLIDIHRKGGPVRAQNQYKETKAEQKSLESCEIEEILDPFDPPSRIRASAENFKIRYFLILPTALVLYLLGFASTIYRLFVRQVLPWESGMLMTMALLIAALGFACFWAMMSLIPGYVSVRSLLGHKTPEGE